MIYYKLKVSGKWVSHDGDGPIPPGFRPKFMDDFAGLYFYVKNITGQKNEEINTDTPVLIEVGCLYQTIGLIDADPNYTKFTQEIIDASAK